MHYLDIYIYKKEERKKEKYDIFLMDKKKKLREKRRHKFIDKRYTIG